MKVVANALLAERIRSLWWRDELKLHCAGDKK